MGILLKRLISWEAFVAVSLVAILQTRLRFSVGFGLGEIGLAVFIGYTFLSLASPKRRLFIPVEFGYVWLYLLFVIGAMFPLTYVSDYLGIPGSSPRDLTAYFLCFLLAFTIVAGQLNIALLGLYYVTILIAVCTIQYTIGGSAAWFYGTRFTAGALNPNQLALYLMCGFVMLPILRIPVAWKWGCAGALLLFTIPTLSDALNVSVFAVMVLWTAMWLVPRNYFSPFVLFCALPVFVLIAALFSETDILHRIAGIWLSSDEGNGRGRLFSNGFAAFFSSPAVWPFGFGAGSFSGMLGPFGAMEAHNTFIDFLTIGGVAGTLLLYYVPIRTAWIAYSGGQRLLAAVILSLIVFSLFHFVARHPIFWVSLVAASYGLSNRTSTRALGQGIRARPDFG